MKIIKDIKQGTNEWLDLRLGYITSSNFQKVLSKGSVTRKAYLYQLTAELISNEKEESYTNKYMEWGIETESQARSMYELVTNSVVEEVAFIYHEKLRAGCSPDGLVGDDGMIEIKCPKSTTQIETILKDRVPSKYIAQIQGQLWISGREWVDFISFDPRLNDKISFYVKRVVRDEAYINELECSIKIFQDELLEIINNLKVFDKEFLF